MAGCETLCTAANPAAGQRYNNLCTQPRQPYPTQAAAGSSSSSSYFRTHINCFNAHLRGLSIHHQQQLQGLVIQPRVAALLHARARHALQRTHHCSSHFSRQALMPPAAHPIFTAAVRSSACPCSASCTTAAAVAEACASAAAAARHRALAQHVRQQRQQQLPERRVGLQLYIQASQSQRCDLRWHNTKNSSSTSSRGRRLKAEYALPRVLIMLALGSSSQPAVLFLSSLLHNKNIGIVSSWCWQCSRKALLTTSSSSSAATHHALRLDAVDALRQQQQPPHRRRAAGSPCCCQRFAQHLSCSTRQQEAAYAA